MSKALRKIGSVGTVIINYFMGELRLGDEIDDYCIKCKRITNHAVVSIVSFKAKQISQRFYFQIKSHRGVIRDKSNPILFYYTIFHMT